MGKDYEPPAPPALTEEEVRSEALNVLRVPGEHLHEALSFEDLLARIETYSLAADEYLAQGKNDQARLAVAEARNATIYLRRRARSHAAHFFILNRRAEDLVATLDLAESESIRAKYLARQAIS